MLAPLPIQPIYHKNGPKGLNLAGTGTPPLTQFFGAGKNHVKGKPHYRRSILVLKPQNGEFEIQSPLFTSFY